MKASEFDRTFDAGGDVSGQVDWSKAKRPNEQAKRVNVDFPAWVVAGLDRQARHLGVTRQALIKLWIAERLQRSGNRTGRRTRARRPDAVDVVGEQGA